jgi:ubiquinone biosynthesis monooxygenase Coq7
MLVSMHSTVDAWLIAADAARRTLTGGSVASRPAPHGDDGPLDAEQKQLSGALMRVNHVGEVCAQALYEGHALTIRDARLAAFFRHAAGEERDHLAWTARRLDELQARPSLLMPLWYAGSLALGAAAGLAGGPRALGFMAETERQVEAHLDGHLERLPAGDASSRAILAQMKLDEARHGAQARDAGADPLPAPVVAAMRLASRVMTTVAERI